jgi:hypothetical protein
LAGSGLGSEMSEHVEKGRRAGLPGSDAGGESGLGRDAQGESYVRAVADALVGQEEVSQRELEAEIGAVRARLELATRRIRAASAEEGSRRRDAGSTNWMRSGADILALKGRLTAAATDEAVLMDLVSEVRRTREDLTNRALCEYARRSKQLLGEDVDVDVTTLKPA